MGLFGDFVDAFKEGMADDATQARAAKSTAQPVNVPAFALYHGYLNLPCLVHQCMTRNAVDVRATGYFSPIVSSLPTFMPLEFKLLKASSKTTPKDWHFDPGDVSVFAPNGQFIGVIDDKRFSKLGGKTGKRFGFVEPPSYDFQEGHGITQEHRVFLFCDYSRIRYDAADFIVGWRP